MIYRAVVADNRDPQKRGRLKVIIPHLGGNSTTDWIWPLIPLGYWVIPDPGEHIFVAFEAGDEETPVWIGTVRTDPDYVDPYTGINLKNVRNLLYRILHLERRVASLEAIHEYTWTDAPEYALGDPGVTDHPGDYPEHVH